MSKTVASLKRSRDREKEKKFQSAPHERHFRKTRDEKSFHPDTTVEIIRSKQQKKDDINFERVWGKEGEEDCKSSSSSFSSLSLSSLNSLDQPPTKEPEEAEEDKLELEKVLKGEGNVNLPMNVETGATPLQVAVQNGFQDIVEVLLDDGAEVNVLDQVKFLFFFFHFFFWI